ncbi:MAG TPA: glycine/betaine ABC transporter permease, partial [Verrucomicrobiae bacterium]|nr:glycine/betaine ABC transporter permease [Verrucomicrobiae bacterium]
MTAAHIAEAPAEARRVDTGLLIWLAAIAFALLCLALRQSVDWIGAYPPSWILPIPDVINAFTDWFDSIFQPFFRAISFALDKPMRAIQAVLQWLPWPAVMLLVGVTALRAGGWKLALFAVASLAYLVIVDYWTQSMNTLA